MILAIIQARMSSTRLPGKVLMPIWGSPMLLVIYERVKQSRKIDQVWVATSIDKTDIPIFDLCHNHRIFCFPGSLNDVLDRFYWAAQMCGPEHIVRITGDCPLIDSNHIDSVICHHIKGEYDYTRDYGFADGLDVECMTFSALCQAWRDSKLPYDREHVTPYFYNNPQLFKLGRFENEKDESNIKWSVDIIEDLVKVRRYYEIAIKESTYAELFKF